MSKKTVFHITHHKAGSQWVKEVLRQSARTRVIKPLPLSEHLTKKPIQQGKIYPTVYMFKEDFDQLLESQTQEIDYKAFYLIRDLRDTLVSLYFSLRFSHKAVSDNVRKQKQALENLNTEQGMIYLINNGLMSQSRRQTSWLDSGIPFFRYEDLITDQFKQFRNIFAHCEIDINAAKLEKIVEKNSFQATSKGREPGQEDPSQHQRKGIAGDWKNHFTEAVKDQFKAKFSDTLIATGYESNSDW